MLDRLEGLAKLTGSERYIDDEPIPGCLWGMTVRSPVARGLVRELRFDSAVDWSRFVVVDHRDIPGPNETYLIENDQPVLAGGDKPVRHVHEAVALIAGEDRHEVRRAAARIRVVVEAQEPALDFRVQAKPSQVQRGTDNTLKRLRIDKGHVESALAGAARVVEGEYQTGAQEHVYIENQGMAAWVEPGAAGAGDVVVVRGSMQCPYYVLNALKHALARPADRVRVIQSPTGGGFGGKEDYPSTLALHAALLALKARRPVKIIYDRGEDMASTTKRHPSLVRHRTGVDREGRLVAQDIDVLLDGGAYVTLSPVVLSRGIIHAAGPYFCPNVRITGRAVLTNTVPFGAFRGFGAPQTLFACERHMDVVAAAIGMDPAEFRRRNLLRDGQTTATGQVISGGTDREALLDEALRISGYAVRKTSRATGVEAGGNASRTTHIRRGMGLATVMHGAGFTGNGEVYLKSRVAVAGLADGRIEILAASTEIGQGTNTVFTQIAAASLDYDPADIVVAVPDTARVPNSGPTVASRTAMVVGRLIERACDDLARAAGLPGGRGAALKAAIVAWHRSHPGQHLAAEVGYEPPPGIAFDESSYRGDAYATFSWGAYVAEVEVDMRTYGVRVTGMTAVQEIGRMLNPTLARGQTQGGLVQGIGWALMEECKYRDGAMINNQLTNYIIPTSDDLPPITVRFVENPYASGGGGAKGLGELPMDGPAPAILNAVADAIGADARTIPLTPERLMELCNEAQRPSAARP